MERMARSVLVVDDSAPFRATARALLEARGYRVVGAVADGGEALAAVEAMRPDAVLLDINLPDADGIAVAGRLTGAGGPAVVLVSTLDGAAMRGAIERSGARGFLSKADLTSPRAGRAAGAAVSLRIVIAEDQALLREGMVRLLEDAGFEVVAEAADAPDLLRKVGAHKPDVAVVDVQMPPDNTDDGLRAALEIRATQPEVGVLVLSQFAEERYAIDLVGDDASGVGYLLKDRVSDFAAFAEAVRRVAAGGVVLDPTVVSHMLGRRRRDDPLDELTPREREVLELMAEGRTNRGIAEVMVVTTAGDREARDRDLLQARPARRAERPPARPSRARLRPALSAAARGRARACPPPGALSTSSVPSSAPTRSASPRSPLPPVEHRAAGAVVLAHLDHELGAGAPDVDAGVGRARRTWRRWSAPPRSRSRPRSRPRSGAARRARSRTRPAPASASPAPRSRRRARAGRAPPDGCRRRARAAPRPPPRRWRSPRSSSSRAAAGSLDQRSRASWRSIFSETSRCCAPSWRSRVEPPALGVARLDDPRPRRPQRLQPRAQLDLEPPVLDRQRRGRSPPRAAAPARRAAPPRGRARPPAGRRGRSRSTARPSPGGGSAIAAPSPST